MIETIVTCPFGHQCEIVKDNKIHRCALYSKVFRGDDSGEQVEEQICALALMPKLQIDTIHAIRGVSSATESFRNEVVQSTEQSQQILIGAAQLLTYRG